MQHWALIEALHAEERFTCAQVAWIFAQCSRLSALDAGGTRRTGHGPNDELPLGVRLVQLFSNFICERIPKLTPAEITTFVVALTSTALPMDEFWLFMMAKRIQDSTAEFSPEQVVTIARRYADRSLEDDEFFEALAERATGAPQEFSLQLLAGLLLACAKIRFRHEGLTGMAVPLFEDPALTASLGGETLGAALTAAGLLDQRAFRPMALCRSLAADPKELRRAVDNTDLLMGLALSVVYFRASAGLRLLLPQLLAHLRTFFTGRRRLGRRGRQEASMVQRRVMLVGLCTAFGVPRPGLWTLSLARQVSSTLEALEEQLDAVGGKDTWEPSPSSFHLEVVAVLRILDVEHTVEHPQRPFALDITVTPEQMRLAQQCWDAAASAA